MAQNTTQTPRSRYATLTIAALSGLLAGGTLMACNSSPAAQKDSTPASKSANSCSAKDGCGAKDEAKKEGDAKASCGAKDEAKKASAGKASCSGKNGCG